MKDKRDVGVSRTNMRFRAAKLIRTPCKVQVKTKDGRTLTFDAIEIESVEGDQ